VHKVIPALGRVSNLLFFKYIAKGQVSRRKSSTLVGDRLAMGQVQVVSYFGSKSQSSSTVQKAQQDKVSLD